MNLEKIVRVVASLRLALSGAIVGVATAGVFVPFESSMSKDTVGAITGFGIVVVIKLAHLI